MPKKFLKIELFLHFQGSVFSFRNLLSPSPTEDSDQKKLVKIAFYQISFTLVLTCYFGLCLLGHLSTLDSFAPRIVVKNRNPSLSFRPLPKHPYSTLIHFTHGASSQSWRYYKSSLKDFMKPYAGYGKFLGTDILSIF